MSVRLFALAVVIVMWGSSLCEAGRTYFVIAEQESAREHGDSFVLPLDAAQDIAHARDLIARGPESAGAPIVFAEVMPGADGVNRDVLADGEPLWNWHVSRFEGFGDVGIELVDGWPTFIERDVQGWMQNTRQVPDDPNAPGHIGFWNYTVVAELPDRPNAVPLPAGVYAGGAMLVGLITRGALRRRRLIAVR